MIAVEESDYTLPPKLVEEVWRLESFLLDGRAAGRITPESPIKAWELCQEWERSRGVQISIKEINEIVNYLRRIRKPIASGEKGYFWAIKGSELESTMGHMRSRMAGMAEALHGLQKAFPSQAELF